MSQNKESSSANVNSATSSVNNVISSANNVTISAINVPSPVNNVPSSANSVTSSTKNVTSPSSNVTSSANNVASSAKSMISPVVNVTSSANNVTSSANNVTSSAQTVSSSANNVTSSANSVASPASNVTSSANNAVTSSANNMTSSTTNVPSSASSVTSSTSIAPRKISVTSRASSMSSLDDASSLSSVPDFGMLKSAMKKSCEEDSTGKRKLSIFNSMMRRVSIHRRESQPTGRIATFLFGVEDRGHDGEHRDDDDEKTELRDVEEQDDHKVKLQHGDKKALHAAKLREGLFLMLSGLYGIIIVILGAVLPITEIFMGDVLDKTFQAFYIYLYVVSIVFLVYVYAYLLRRNQLRSEFLTRTLSRSLSWTRAWSKTLAKGDTDAKGKRKKMISLDSNHHTGTFYLRLGVLGFGIGSMIHSGLNFGAYVSAASICREAIQAIKPVIHLIFTFFQLYFIFMNSKMCIHRYKKLARFGLMHMCATNICVWFNSIVVETMHVIHLQHAGHHGEGHHGEGHHGGDHHNVPGGHDDHSGSDHHADDVQHHGHDDSNGDYGNAVYALVNTTAANIGRKLHGAVETSQSGNGSYLDDACQWSDMMGKAVEASGTYLYPCTIEYSLMCAGILYVMWKNVGTRPRIPRDHSHHSDEDENRHLMSVDCTSSSRGLFLGILLTVGTIISIISFYMMNNNEDMKLSGIILAHLSETFVYTITLIALFLAAYRMKGLTFHPDHPVDLEDILVLISFTGLLAFIIFSLVASILSEPTTKSGLTILSNLFMLLQSTTQTLFMLAGDRLTASTESQARKKPGREFITFLLISNFAMWALNTFETQTPQHNPVQVEFYGPTAWAIFTHISVPLGIYYRFHSTVCFSNIWKNAWKRKSH